MGTISNSLSLARNLAEYAMYYGDPGRINTRWDRLASFNAADVQRIAKEYLTPENRTVVISRPKAAAARGGTQ
jgi:predicted Zn-dependent peptidase